MDLGILLSVEQNLGSLVKKQPRRHGVNWSHLERLGSRRPKIPLSMHKTFARPHLEYCVQAWGLQMARDKTIR